MSETTMNNMECADIKALLSALVDDQVDAETRHRAERHLATCATCRKMLDEAEALDDLMARDSEQLTGGSALPAGFEAAVIEQALAEQPTMRRSLVTWAGWVAAAACLMLAVLIWSFDRQLLIDSNAPMAANTPQDNARADAGDNTQPAGNLVRAANYQRRSWTFDGDLPDDVFGASTSRTDDDAPAVKPMMDSLAPAQIDPAFARGDEADDAGQVARAAADLARQQANLSSDDVLTLHSVALLMETLEDADLRNFEEVERIRRIAEYDELLPRLAATKQRLSAEDRAVVRVAESILLRIVRGPVTEQIAHELWSDAAEFELAGALQAIGGERRPRPSL